MGMSPPQDLFHKGHHALLLPTYPSRHEHQENLPLSFADVLAETREIVQLALPVIFSYIMEFGLPIITYAAVGHLGVRELDGLALGTMTSNITGMSLVTGLTLAMDTLASQAYGACDYVRVGILAQRAFLICLSSCLPVAILWWNIEPLLCMLGQDPSSSRLAAVYLRVFSLYLPPFVVFEVAKKFIIAQGLVAPMMYIMALSCILHAMVTYVLIWPLGLGFLGSPIALVVTYCNLATLSVAYITFSRGWVPGGGTVDPARCWGGWSRDAWTDWGPFLYYGVFGLVQFGLEWWAWEAMLLLSGMLGPKPMAANAITSQLGTFLYNFPLGVSVAAAVRVGQALGAGAPRRARRACVVAIGIAAAQACVLATVALQARGFWAGLFTQSSNVQALVDPLLIIVACIMFGDGIQVACAGVLRGAGLQAYGAGISCVGMFAIGLPLGVALAFGRGWGVSGLWYGYLIAQLVSACGHLTVVYTIPWGTQAKQARRRTSLSFPSECTSLLDRGP
eukprot:TRINITY_DN6741_c0_g1_i1.p1 TRINITY_DN6741_c0_g1~~TRINITY_DN6741_c0_g1_i1.p1  ORF type:complete len:507 (+),score=54.71 TRINITY_DN6741_c0_g1_i1:1-1521(+)